MWFVLEVVPCAILIILYLQSEKRKYETWMIQTQNESIFIGIQGHSPSTTTPRKKVLLRDY